MNAHDTRNTDNFIGKTLSEAKESYGGHVRVMGAGEASFVGTMDYRTDRLNVCLEGGGLKFTTKEYEVGGQTYPMVEVDEDSLDTGIVVKAWFG